MNKYFYSKQENSFYAKELLDSYIEQGSFPSDAIEVEDKCYEEFSVFENADGMVRMGGHDGLPFWAKKTALPIEQQVENAELQKKKLINDVTMEISILQDAIEFGQFSKGDQEKLEKLRLHRVLLSQVNTKLGDASRFPEHP